MNKDTPKILMFLGFVIFIISVSFIGGKIISNNDSDISTSETQNSDISNATSTNIDSNKELVSNTVTDTGNEVDVLEQPKKIEPNSIKELDFNIDAKFTGYGDIESKITTNILNNEINMYVFSITKISPESEESYGIDDSRLYPRILQVEHRNYNLNDSAPEYNQFTNGNGELDSKFVLFHDKSKEKNYTQYEIDNLKSSQSYSDESLAGYIEVRKIFDKDKKIIIDYRLGEGKLKDLGFDFDNLKLPSICKKLEYTDYGRTSKEISCKKELKYTGVFDKKTVSGINIISHSSKSYINRSGANQDCKFSKNGRLPTKEEVKNNLTSILALFKGTNIKYVWTYEENGGNINGTEEWAGWIEPVSGNGVGKWLKILSPMAEEKIDYVGYICVGK